MKLQRPSFRIRTVTAISLLILIVNTALGIMLANRSRSDIMRLIESGMLDIVNTAAKMVDGGELKAVSSDDFSDPAYSAVYKTLPVFMDNTKHDYIYAIRKNDDGAFMLIVDPAKDGAGKYGTPIHTTDALLCAATGTPAVDNEPYTDEFGRFYSAYSPVFDSSGSLAGIVAADISADRYESFIINTALMIIFAFVLSLIVCTVTAGLFVGYYGKRFRRVSAELGELADDIEGLTKELAPGGRVTVHHDTGSDDILTLANRMTVLRTEMHEYVIHFNTQANSMITAMASDYRNVYYIDLDNDTGVCCRGDPNDKDQTPEGMELRFHERFKWYGEHFVAESYREGFLSFIDPDNIREALAEKPLIAYRYLANRNGEEYYEMIRMASVKRAGEAGDGVIHAIGLGLTDIDTEMRESMALNRALSDALAAAEEANKAKTTFLSSVSHEIRTPMNAVIGLAGIALDDPGLSPKTRDHLTKIDASAKHLLNLINEILDMSRIESGRMILKSEVFSFSALLEQVNALFSARCAESRQSYSCRVIGVLGDRYIGDSMKLRQILINILSNAVKFTPEGGSIDFTVERTAQFGGRSTLRFTVSDTGIGISEEFLPHIFDTFTQEDGSSTNKYGSSGLGLAITKNIVSIMNGDISVQSEKDKGTVFTVTLTFTDSPQSPPEDGEAEVLPERISVLVVDDDPVTCDHAKLIFGKVGITCETVLSGARAVENARVRAARQKPYDLILVDLYMPGMNGIDAAKKLREIVGNGSAIIIITAYRWDDVLDEADSAGVDGFISKPLFVNSVLEEFKNALKRKGVGADYTKKRTELSGKNILLAEDIQINAEIIKMLLKKRGMNVDHALNGSLVVERFRESPEDYYDAILMDIRMPEKDGLEATEEIRALDRSDARSVPIIALTANAFDEDVKRSLQAGMNAHLTKPIDNEALFATLESFIGEIGE